MKGPVKAVVLAAAVVVLVGGAFFGGLAFQKSRTTAAGPGAQMAADGTMPQGGPMANLTEEEQAELDSMTEEERQQWMQENMGSRGGAPDGTGAARGGSLEGEVIEAADDSITVSLDSGSQTFYLDENTVVAYEKGAGDLAAGSNVMVIATPAADGVTTASLVVVTQP